MAEAKKSNDIGAKRGHVLATLRQEKQLNVIAEGLPILMNSARDLLAASKALSDRHRAAAILEIHAMEEVSKILILVDIVRCPPKLRSSRFGPMMTWFYDHLARLIYINAQSWKPKNVKQLQEYVDHHRKSHYLEGAVGEYIMPNWTTWSRESILYADIITDEDGEPMWNEPCVDVPMFNYRDPFPWQVCEALLAMGVFSRKGLDIMSALWSQTEFADDQHWSDTERLTYEMMVALNNDGLITDAAQNEHQDILYNHWQVPMYNIDFKRIEVSLTELQAERDAKFWSEVGVL